MELLYLRAICYHALGYARQAAGDYDACMHATPRMDDGPVGEESRCARRAGVLFCVRLGCV